MFNTIYTVSDSESLLGKTKEDLIEMLDPLSRELLLKEGKKFNEVIDDDYINCCDLVQLRDLVGLAEELKGEIVFNGIFAGQIEEDQEKEMIADALYAEDMIGKKCEGMRLATDIENLKRDAEKIVKEVHDGMKTYHVGKQPTKLIERTLVEGRINESGDFSTRPYQPLLSPIPLVEICKDLADKKETLTQEFPWFANIISNLFKQIEARQNISTERYFKIRPLLIVGGPGCGKSTFARRFSEEMNVTFNFVMAGGSSDSVILKGVTRGWGSARPSLPCEVIAKNCTGNPLFIIDEIDKTSRSEKGGSILDVLLQMIEPSTSSNYYDDCLLVKIDLSYCNWIATANSLSNIPMPLLDRFNIVFAPDPSPEDSLNIARSCLKSIARRYYVTVEILPTLSDLEIEIDLISRLTPRQINKLIEQKVEEFLVKKPKFYN